MTNAPVTQNMSNAIIVEGNTKFSIIDTDYGANFYRWNPDSKFWVFLGTAASVERAREWVAAYDAELTY